MDSKYCYPGTDVLINKFNIKNNVKLHEVEQSITSRKYSDLIRSGVNGPFNFNCLLSIHKFLFEDIYPFAGKIRNVDIAKVNLFCRATFIEDQARSIFKNLKNDNFLKGFDRKNFISKLVDYMSDVNALHPFREGNGRTLRLFFDALSKNAGYHINFSEMNPDQLLAADIEAINGHTDKLRTLLNGHCYNLYGERIVSEEFSNEDIKQFNDLQFERLNKYKEQNKAEKQIQLSQEYEIEK